MTVTQGELERLLDHIGSLETRVADLEKLEQADVPITGVPTAVAQGNILVADSDPKWAILSIGGAHFLAKVNGAGTDLGYEAFDWDDVGAAAGADMVHTHQSNAEGAKIDHGLALDGLADDDHTQYLLDTGARVGASSQDQKFTNDVRALRGLSVGSDTDPDDNDVHIAGSINVSTALGCFARRNSTQSIPNAVWTALSFDTQVWDTDGCFAPTSTDMQPQHSGYYAMGGSVYFASHNTGIRGIAIWHGGIGFLCRQVRNTIAGVAPELTISTGMVWCDAGQTIRIYVYQNSGAALNATVNVYMPNGWIAREA